MNYKICRIKSCEDGKYKFDLCWKHYLKEKSMHDFIRQIKYEGETK